jgi:hypothetical protein
MAVGVWLCSTSAVVSDAKTARTMRAANSSKCIAGRREFSDVNPLEVIRQVVQLAARLFDRASPFATLALAPPGMCGGACRRADLRGQARNGYSNEEHGSLVATTSRTEFR